MLLVLRMMLTSKPLTDSILIQKQRRYLWDNGEMTLMDKLADVTDLGYS